MLGCMMMPGIASLPAAAITDPLTRTIGIKDGLPSNSVRNIVQDQDGFLWFGTDNGLCRYDGYTVQAFVNPKMQLDQYVSSLASCDDGILVGTNHGAYLLSFSTRNFQKLSEKITASVSHISVDADRNVWVSTHGQGLFRYNLTTHQCKQYAMKAMQGRVATTLVDADNQVWALGNRKNGGLMRLNKATDNFEWARLHGDATQLSGMAMLAMPDGSIMVGTWENGLYQVMPDGTVKMLISQQLTNVVNHIHVLHNDRGLYVMVGSDDGLVEYDLKEQSWRMLSEVDDPSHSTNERFVYDLTADQEGGMWIGTFYGGVSYMPSLAHERRFTPYHASLGGLKGSVVSRFYEDNQHRIWIATDDAGVDLYDPVKDEFLNYPARSVMSRMNVHALLAEGSQLWVGTYGNGIIQMNMLTGAMQYYTTDLRPEGGNCYNLFRDSKHRLWAASLERVNLWNDEKQAFLPVGPIKSCAIDIEEDAYGNVWFATQGEGLWCYRNNGQWKQYKYEEDKASSLCSDMVNCIRRDNSGQLYVATSRGLCVYQSGSDSFKRIQMHVPSQDFASIVVYQSEIWLSGNMGIVRYVPGEQPRVFNWYDGLTSDLFLPNSGLLASDGRIYFGTQQGFNAFYSYNVKINKVAPPVAITSILFFNHDEGEDADGQEDAGDVGTGFKSKKAIQYLNHVKEIVLGYDENMFNIAFSALSYVTPEKNQYRYKLEGFDKDWQYTTDHRATYTNLLPGTYIFHVMAANNDGVWSKNDAQLKIVVNPPFWWSLPAKIIYLLLIGYGIFWITQSRLKREKRRHQRQLERMEEQQEREMHESRLHFFTMIAHEIRTPVTLIIGPLENMKEQWKQLLNAMRSGEKITKTLKEGEEMTQTLDVIDRNAQRLLLLVNQLLDFSKVQQKDMQVHFKLQNISKLMRNVVERFEPSYEQQGIQLEVEYPEDDFAAMVDGEAITKVLSNLMVNAGKYTQDYVLMACSMPDADHFTIRVTDNGMGISDDDKQKIFAAFYQARDNKPGTGIGLSIVKNLVDAHHGKVEVESEIGKGSTFIVTLPIQQADAVVGEGENDEVVKVPRMPDDAQTEGLNPGAGNADGTSIDGGIGSTAGNADGIGNAAGMGVATAAEGNGAYDSGKSHKPVMLVVDDDADMCGFVKGHFDKEYIVLTAENGKQALRILDKYSVSVIVSDWMMPEMDGPELCRQVRSKDSISHLPFVMLTAKTDDASKAEGRSCGADTFIEKPFSMKYLDASVKQLLDMRRLLQSKFSGSPLEPIEELAPTQMDSEFLARLTAIIEENVTNPELNVNFLANKMGMGRSSFFNKIRGLADVTPNEMIMLVKLKKAARLLKQKRYKVTEISFMLGFSSSSYFSKCFQKQFGVKPGDFVNLVEGE